MTLKLNYELIYKVRKGGYKTDSQSNLRVQFQNKARDEADKLYAAYVAFLKKEIGHDRFEVTNIACMADGVCGHVYVDDYPSAPRNIGKRKCAFCGCDDFDY